MKKKIPMVLLTALFALPIPVALLGGFVTGIGFLAAILSGATFFEILLTAVGVIIGGTYLISFAFSMHKMWNEKKYSIVTFLPIAHCLLALIYLLSMFPAANYIGEITEHFGFAKKDFVVIDELDTHGGFHGDGSYYLILDCSNDRELALDKIKTWKKLPLTENLNLFMYGGEKDGVSYSSRKAEEAHIPRIENGYYIFKDRFPGSKNRQDDSELLDRYSYNFSIAFYDCDTDRMYYYELDT